MMPIEAKQLTIPARIESVEAACEFVSDFARAAGLDRELIYHCYLAVEEVCANIIEHGYPPHAGKKTIEIECGIIQKGLQIKISDNARPFNPLKIPAPDPNKPLWERRTGGWGIFFVRKFMDRLEYQYQDERNQFIMEKYLTSVAKR